MYVYGIKKRRDNILTWFIIVVIIAVIILVPALPGVGIWLWLDPATFWQKLLLFAFIAGIIYPALFVIEFIILKLICD